MYRLLRATAAALILAVTLTAGAHRIGPVPPLGPLLDPVNGAWGSASQAAPPANTTLAIPGLSAPVEVRYDIRGVPHIFAATETDVYTALGYVVARDRLFQLELQSRAASGRLTEIAGSRALKFDEEQRRLGLPRAAERKLAAVDTSSPTWHAVRAYANGVNAYIDGLAPRDWPMEYRLLGTRPERWTPINSIHLLNRMGWTLAYATPELTRLGAQALVGAQAAASIFPANSPIQEPIQPTGASSPRFDLTPIAPPGAPDASANDVANVVAQNTPPHRQNDDAEHEQLEASNNWAVAPQRTRDGHALLAGDPHLNLTLPSIWYEAHLVVPGTLDVYGVTIPGAPVIVIGFNRDVAWTFTNTSADVLDFYRESVDNTAAPTKYRVDGVWHPIERRVERYLGTGGELIAADTVYYTHRGPLMHRGNNWLSMRWTVLEPSDELRAFLTGAHATTAAQFQQAMGEFYFAPAQNMLAADRGGHIMIRSTGHFPIRPHGDGLGIADGGSSANDWRGFWPVNAYPQSADPGQGFLASANQQPIDPSQTPRYIGADESFAPWRAMRINTLLRSDSAVTPDAMRRYQTDPGSARADLFVPYFLAAARLSHDSVVATAAHLLAEWDRRYTRDNRRAVLFEAAMRQLIDLTWDELVPSGSSTRVATPTTTVLAQLLAQPENRWWDDRRTQTVETRDDILARALRTAYAEVTARHGAPNGAGWRWDNVQRANIYHLLHIPALSALDIPVQGGPSTLSPFIGDGTHSASWRMVVELGPRIQAWGTYPGGQSGNPSSVRYREHIAEWADGRLESLVVPSSASALAPAQTSATLTLTPRK